MNRLNLVLSALVVLPVTIVNLFLFQLVLVAILKPFFFQLLPLPNSDMIGSSARAPHTPLQAVRAPATSFFERLRRVLFAHLPTQSKFLKKEDKRLSFTTEPHIDKMDSLEADVARLTDELQKATVREAGLKIEVDRAHERVGITLKQLVASDARVVELEKSLNAKQAQVDDMNTALAIKDAQMDHLKDEMKECNDKLAAHDTKTELLQIEATLKDTRVTDVETELALCKSRLDNLQDFETRKTVLENEVLELKAHVADCRENCIMCKDALATMVYQPCWHLAACEPCSSAWAREHSRRCPACNRANTTPRRVFRA